jgi:hypothetical protein
VHVSAGSENSDEPVKASVSARSNSHAGPRRGRAELFELVADFFVAGAVGEDAFEILSGDRLRALDEVVLVSSLCRLSGLSGAFAAKRGSR